MARDATARLYDVDENSVVFRKLQKSDRYDQGTITFRARKGKLINLDKLHESVWASRLSGGTRSGLVSLEVSAIGQVVNTDGRSVLVVSGSDSRFDLRKHPQGEHAAAFSKLQTVAGTKNVKLTGRIEGYAGRWPGVLRKVPQKPRRILVTGVEVLDVQQPQ